MGYETKIIIGKSCLKKREWERDKENPFSDGSGFPYKKDEKGEYIESGRDESWFQIYAEVDLCKLGYQDDALNRLSAASHDKERAKKEVFYIYGLDGNTQFTEDRYGDPLMPLPIKIALDAMKKSIDKTNPYRRIEWAIALLEEMSKDKEQLEVIFWGH